MSPEGRWRWLKSFAAQGSWWLHPRGTVTSLSCMSKYGKVPLCLHFQSQVELSLHHSPPEHLAHQGAYIVPFLIKLLCCPGVSFARSDRNAAPSAIPGCGKQMWHTSEMGLGPERALQAPQPSQGCCQDLQELSLCSFICF